MRLIDADALITHIKECMEAKNANFEWDQVEGLKVALSCIDEASTIEPEASWIPCAMKLPEDRTYCFVTQKVGPVRFTSSAAYACDLSNVSKYDFCDKKNTSGFYYHDSEDGYVEAVDVVAWIPLPKPYEGA